MSLTEISQETPRCDLAIEPVRGSFWFPANPLPAMLCYGTPRSTINSNLTLLFLLAFGYMSGGIDVLHHASEGNTMPGSTERSMYQTDNLPGSGWLWLFSSRLRQRPVCSARPNRRWLFGELGACSPCLPGSRPGSNPRQRSHGMYSTNHGLVIWPVPTPHVVEYMLIKFHWRLAQTTAGVFGSIIAPQISNFNL